MRAYFMGLSLALLFVAGFGYIPMRPAAIGLLMAAAIYFVTAVYFIITERDEDLE